MKTIRNKTHKALKVPLPQGKVLHLGPLKTGQISVHAVDHPPLQRLVAAGEVELLDDAGQRTGAAGGEPAGHPSTHGHHPDTSVHHRGDR